MKPSASEIEAIVARPYARVLERGEDGIYTAYIAELSGCISEGATPNEAISQLDEALTGIVRSMLEAGDEIPLPLSAREYSGRLMLRVPPSLHARAALYAALERVSLNRLLSDAVAEHVGAASERARNPSSRSSLLLDVLRAAEDADSASPGRIVDLMEALEASIASARAPRARRTRAATG